MSRTKENADRRKRQLRANKRQTARRDAEAYGDAPDEELNAEFEYSRTLDKLDWQLLVENRYDLDGSWRPRLCSRWPVRCGPDKEQSRCRPIN